MILAHTNRQKKRFEKEKVTKQSGQRWEGENTHITQETNIKNDFDPF
jgi:hypothetical protein